MITGVITVPNNLNTFIVNVLLSNNGGEFLPTPSFEFGKELYCIFNSILLLLIGKVGPVTNIKFSIDNCSTINITWSAPSIIDDRVSIQYYILRIYDAITGSLVDAGSVYENSYQFVDNNLFIHGYTYVITGVNELGEGISNNDTFSYQRGANNYKQNTELMILCLVPRSITEADSNILTFNETTATASYNIPVTYFIIINLYYNNDRLLWNVLEKLLRMLQLLYSVLELVLYFIKYI